MASLSSGNPRVALRLGIAVLAAVVGVVLAVSTAAAAQTTFATPDQAVDALVAAVRTGDTGKVEKILGLGSRKLLVSGDPVADARSRAKFVAAYEAAKKITKEGDSRAVLMVGEDDWSFPFPIVARDGRWRFDASAGASEILDRRIGDNELSAIEVCRAYVDAQREFASMSHGDGRFVEYAQKFLSSPGRHDGLYWPEVPGGPESPLGPLVASARAEGYTAGKTKGHTPYHGYYYRILKGQGEASKDGAYDYVIKGHMIAGFALVAFPAQYGASGIMTFIVNHDGIVYQKDLGPKTATLAGKMTLFNPDSSWKTP